MFNNWGQRLLVGEHAFRAPSRKEALPGLLEEIKVPCYSSILVARISH